MTLVFLNPKNYPLWAKISVELKDIIRTYAAKERDAPTPVFYYCYSSAGILPANG